MKLYLTLEDNDTLKVERVIQLESEEYNPSILKIVEDMQDTLNRVKEESVKLEARRLTINND